MFAVEGEGCTTMGGDATPGVPNPGQPAIWNHSGAVLPAWENFLIPFFRALVQEELIPSKVDVIAETKVAITDDITTVTNMNANDTRCQSLSNCFNEGADSILVLYSSLVAMDTRARTHARILSFSCM